MKHWRIKGILSFIALFYVVLGWNVFTIQVKEGATYLERAEARVGGEESALARRGHIFTKDRSGNATPIVLNKEFPVAFAVPKEIKNPEATATQVAEVLGLNRDDLAQIFSKQNDPYEPLLKKISETQARALTALQLPGIYVRNEGFRFYPFDRLAAHVLGFVGPSGDNAYDEGRYGVELLKDNVLREGETVVLTIDRNTQAQSERVLSDLVERFRAAGGSVIIEEVGTGRIVALGNMPSFDPNNYVDVAVRDYLNPAVQSVYEPGSVFKPITMAIGLDTGAITPDTTFYDNGELTLNGYTIKNWDLKAYGKTTMTEVIERSINTGAAFAARQIGREPFYNYLVKFGFDRKTGIELPGEVIGNLNNLIDYPRDINYATAAFGQGVAVTPIELISAFSAIANEGVMMRPYILEATGSEAVQRVISREAAAQTIEMMFSAVEKSHVAQIPGYTIAGKTGTAQVPDRGGYSDDFVHTYVGFVPAKKPRFAVLLKIDKPKGVILAGSTVVPAFRELAEFLINYYNLPPDNLETE
jgi:cell division protein FtsI/penicillin-binding protein 2